MDRYIELNEDKTPKSTFDKFYSDTSNLENAGLILEEDVVVVDFDTNGHLAEDILKIKRTRCVLTNRGCHLYYKVPKDLSIKNTTKITTVMGNKVDYKTGFNGKKAYAIVKLNGEYRKVINEDVVDYPELPKLLYPTKTKEELYNLQEGSRNDTLYKHLFNVIDVLKDKDYTLKLVSMINSNFKEPLDNNELNNIVNSVFKSLEINIEEDFINVYNEDKKGNKTLDIYALSRLLIKKLSIVNYNDNLYFKEGYKYITGENKLLGYVKKLGFVLTITQSRELLHQLKTNIDIMLKSDGLLKLPIILNNNFQIKDGNVTYYDGDFSPFFLDVDYNPTAYDVNVDNFLNFFVSDSKELRILLEEILGHIIMTHSFPHHSFFFVSIVGNNGKSTFFEMISNFVGRLGSNLALEELKKAETLPMLENKLVNCGDDINHHKVFNSRLFKNLTSGNIINARELYKAHGYSFKPSATLLFSCNDMPEFDDKSGGIERRIRVIPCKNTVKVIDTSIIYKLSTKNAKSYILNLALKGMKRILENGGVMINPIESQEVTKLYIEESDIFKNFIKYCNEEEIAIDVDCNAIYLQYINFCTDEGVKDYMTKNKFTRRLKDFGYEVKQIRSENGRNKFKRVYVKI